MLAIILIGVLYFITLLFIFLLVVLGKQPFKFIVQLSKNKKIHMEAGTKPNNKKKQ